MNQKLFMLEENVDTMPRIRIRKVRLENFKSVRMGEILLCEEKAETLLNREPDILGIYGQNGSGKTSFIEALSILKQLMLGAPIHENYTDCVALDADHASLSFHFDLVYPDDSCREAVYSFCLAREQVQVDVDITGEMTEEGEEEQKWRIVVFNETVSLSWDENGVRRNLQTIIDTSTEAEVFGPATKRRILAGGSKQCLMDLSINKVLAREKSQSFVFMRHTLQTFWEHGGDSVFLRVLLELRYYAYARLFVVDSRSTGLIRLNVALPLYTTKGLVMLNLNSPTQISDKMYPRVVEQMESVSLVLSQLVPGLRIGLKQTGEGVDKKGNAVRKVVLVGCRGGLEMPLRDESDGVRKIISVLGLIIAAFNHESVTVAIDEFDAGIFEYLLGEILQAMEESGRGQFIFTSHNLRPLEVIRKRYLCFTTTNPDRRYVRLKGAGTSDNLRDAYFREIIIGEQDEELYRATKRFKIVAALRKAGAGA